LVAYLLIFNSIPHEAKIIDKLVPPYEKKGKGMPVNGDNAVIEEIFKKPEIIGEHLNEPNQINEQN